jgi:hypothetical protein
LFKDAVLHCDVDKISPIMLISSELELETVLADQCDQFKRAGRVEIGT